MKSLGKPQGNSAFTGLFLDKKVRLLQEKIGNIKEREKKNKRT